jgi:hypothetical protein
MIKKVNIHPVRPIYGLRVPITGVVFGTSMSVGDILVCIHARARVNEILPDGKLLPLNLSNYNKVNHIDTEVKKETPVEVAVSVTGGSTNTDTVIQTVKVPEAASVVATTEAVEEEKKEIIEGSTSTSIEEKVEEKIEVAEGSTEAETTVPVDNEENVEKTDNQSKFIKNNYQSKKEQIKRR